MEGFLTKRLGLGLLHRPSAIINETALNPGVASAFGPQDHAFGGRFDIKHWYDPASAFPWNATILLCLFAFSFLLLWGYAYIVHRRRHTVMRGLEPLPVESLQEEDDSIFELRRNLHVMCGSLEHSLPHLHNAKAVAGGLGKVIHMIGRHHPTRITMVHPMLNRSDLDYGDLEHEELPLRLLVDGKHEEVRVFRQQGPDAMGPDGVQVDFLLLSHPSFEVRTRRDIYPNPMTRLNVLRFYSLWNQSFAALIVQHKPGIVHTPDFHTAVAPWYAVRELPYLKILLVLHNAEYQGGISTDMIRGPSLERLANIWNLPVSITKKHLVFEGRFNMLKAGVDFVMLKQGGRGIHAVSTHYADEVNRKFSLFWQCKVQGLDNPMLEEERPILTEPLKDRKASAKLEVQKLLHLNEDPEARIFVSLGRLVRMKGVDIIADIAPWLLSEFPKAQLIVIGPVADAYGEYTKEKLSLVSKEPAFEGRLFVHTEFMRVPEALKFAADFCIMPSRDEPFGYVDVEFAWHGALMVGAEAGGLGKVPGFYYLAQNRENIGRLRRELARVISKAMEAPAEQLQSMASQAFVCEFPLATWQNKLLKGYRAILPGHVMMPDLPPHMPPSGSVVLSELENSSSNQIIPQQKPVNTFKPFEPKQHKPRNLVDAVAMVPRLLEDQWVGRPPQLQREQSVLSNRQPAEFLTQELSSEELSDRVREKLATHPDLNMDEVVEAIGSEVCIERERENSWERFLLTKKCGVECVHWLVVFGYVVAPVIDSLTMVVCSEWALRTGARLGQISFTFGGQNISIQFEWNSMPAIFFFFFVLQGLAYLLGPPSWAALTKYIEPRKVLGGNLLLQFLFLPMVLIISSQTICTELSLSDGIACTGSYGGSLTVGMLIVFLKCFVSSCALVFLSLSFMMSIKADMSYAAIRMGIIEAARYTLTFLPVGYILLVSPTNLTGTREHPVPISIFLVLMPIILLIAIITLVPGVFLFFWGPGPYRDDRFPGWEARLVFKRKSFCILALSDCIGALYLFPSVTYIWWWFSQGSSVAGTGWLFFLFTAILVVGISFWAKALSEASKHGYGFLIGATVLMAPPAVIRAMAQEEVSNWVITDEGVSFMALLLCMLSVLLEGMRTTAQWTAKIKVLDSRWRLLSYGTLNISAAAFFGIISVFSTWGAATEGGMALGTLMPKPLADMAFYVVVPLAMFVQFPIQVLATLFIYRDIGSPLRPVKGRQNRCVRALTAPCVIAAFVVIITALVSLPGFSHLSKTDLFVPTRRCSGTWSPIDAEHLLQSCQAVHAEAGSAFERNLNQQITLARYNCLQLMKQRGGNTFLLVIKPGVADNECHVLTCSADAVSAPQPIDPFAAWDQDREVWSHHCELSNNVVGVQLMEWNWEDIGEECARLGKEGWNFVHVSPPAEHILGNQSCIKYQPVSNKLDSRSGSEDDFRRMVAKCRSHGVSIMVDFIVNHFASAFPMPDVLPYFPKKTNDDFKKECGLNIACEGWNGTQFRSRQYGCKDWNSEDCEIDRSAFHHFVGNDASNCGMVMGKTGKTIVNIIQDMTLCDVEGWTDLNTELLSTQRRVQDYLLRLTDAGVTMLRVDAAMLVWAKSLAKIVEPFPWEFMTQEMIGWSKVQEAQQDLKLRFRVSTLYDSMWAMTLSPILQDPKKFGSLPYQRPAPSYNKSITTSGWLSETMPQSNDVFIYIDNQDAMCRSTPAPGGTFSYHAGGYYHSVMLFMLFQPWGAGARIMSSFYYDNSDPKVGPQTIPPPMQGDPADFSTILHGRVQSVKCRVAPKTTPATDDPAWANGTCADSNGAGCQWICQHRWPGVAALVRFRRLVGKEVNFERVNDDKDGHLSFSLNNVGFMAMTFWNRKEWSLKGRQTGLPGGRYCNIASLSGALPIPDQWPKSEGRTQCSGAAIDVDKDVDGTVLHGQVPAGGTVVLHARYTLQ